MSYNLTVKEFNEKWKDYLEEGFYGLQISVPHVIAYLDNIFENELTKDPNFKYSQIKTKWNWVCFYSNASKEVNRKIEAIISEILKTYET
jgi:hypothetical protein